MNTVLFLCTANSARSQMAEALTNYFRSDSWHAFSAGVSTGSHVHPMALAALQDLDIPVSDLAPKSLELFSDSELDLVVTVCDNAANNCPALFQPGRMVNVPFADPSRTNEAGRRAAFFDTRDLMRRNLVDRLDELLRKL